MKLEGANAFSENNLFTIYTVNSMTSGEYAVVMPKEVMGTVNMLIDFHQKSFFDNLISGSKTKDDLMKVLEGEYNFIKNTYANFMLVLPMFDENSYTSIVNSKDKQKMFDEVKKIGAITSEVYKKVTESGFNAQNIDQKIIVLEKTNEDTSFVEWLKEQMPNFVEGLKYQEEKKEVVNPFMGVNPFGPAPVENPTSTTVQPSGNSIFDTPVTPQPAVQPEPVVTPTIEATPNNDIFGTSAPQTPTPVQQSSNETPIENTNSIFGNPTPTQTTVEPTQQVQSTMPNIGFSTPAENVTTKVADPQPINTVDLEGTTAFRPIPGDTTQIQNPNPTTATPVEEKSIEEVQEEHKSSKGIANLLILLVILVGVTLASIELGKFLYNVYGK